MPQRIPMRSARLAAAIRPTDLSEAFVPMSNLPRHPHSSRLGSASGLILLKVSVILFSGAAALCGRPAIFDKSECSSRLGVRVAEGGGSWRARVENTLTLGGLS